MQLVYADAVYGPTRFSSFHISEAARSAIDCADYREEEYDTLMDMLDKTEQTISDFLRRLFGKKKRERERQQDNE